jgi:hypothetical protein
MLFCTKKKATLIFLGIIVQLSLCDYKSVVTQIDQQSQLKQNDALQKNQLLSTLGQ